MRKVVLAHLAVPDRDAGVGDQLLDPFGCLLDGAHPVVDVVDLAPSLQLSRDCLADQLVLVRGDVGLDRLAFFGRSLDDAHVSDPTHRHVQRPRDRSRRQRKHVELGAQLLQPLLLHHAEPVLLIDDEQPESFEAHVTLKQAMGADDDVDLAGLDAFDGASLRLIVHESREHLNHDGKLGKPCAKNVKVLLGEHRRRRKERDLFTAHRGLERRAKRQLGLAKPDVAAQQPVHGSVRLHVRLDLSQGGDLVGGLLIRKRRLELRLPGGVGSERDARPRLPQRIDFEQLVGDILHDLARPATRSGPVARPEPVERRLSFAAEIFLDAIQVLDGHEKAVSLRVLELEVFAVGAFRLDQPHSFE